MTPQHRELTDKQFSALAQKGDNVDTLGWAALHAEALVPIEEHAECKEVLERVGKALREREKTLRKDAIKRGRGPRLPHQR